MRTSGVIRLTRAQDGEAHPLEQERQCRMDLPRVLLPPLLFVENRAFGIPVPMDVTSTTSVRVNKPILSE